MDRPPLIIAHRGFSGRYPENTLAAVRGALQVGSDLVEIDVQETADGQIVVFHDFQLRRLCQIRGNVSQASLRQLRQSKPDIPTLRQVLSAVCGKCRLLIEIKQACPRKVAAVVERSGMVGQVIAFAFSIPKLIELAEVSPKICRFGLVGDDLHRSLTDLLDQVKVDGIGVAGRLLRTPADVRRIHDRVEQVYVWTVNSPRRMRELREWGVDGIITNRPDLARQIWPDVR